MYKWNCLVIDDTIEENNKIEYIVKIPDNIRLEMTKWYNFRSYNFEDYDVFFINFKENYEFDYDNNFALRLLASEELKQIKFIFASKINSLVAHFYHKKKDEISDIISHLWKSIPPSINKKGNKIIKTNPDNILSKLIFNEKSRPFHWEWAILPEKLPDQSYILAKNKKGNIISFIVRFKNNVLILLPQVTSKRDFIENILSNLDKFMDELFNRGLDYTINKPKWLADYDLFKKEALINELQELEEKIKRIESYEILLYGYGKSLENSISSIFSFLGFQNIKQTVDRADLICETEDKELIVEIKGLKDIAHERNINQMYKWHAEALQKEEKKIKKVRQIFICNAYRDKNPEEREIFFDEKVIKIAQTHDWGLLSTLELYHSLLKIGQCELKKEEVISVIENQIGIINLRKIVS